MRIAIIGAGGVGGTFGAALARSGQEVRLLARGRHFAAMRERGLQVTGALGDFLVRPIAVTDSPDELGAADAVLLTVKLWDVEEAVGSLRNVIGPRTLVVTLQNGVDAPAQVAALIGAGQVAAGSCFVNASIKEPGVIQQRSPSQKIVAGVLSGGHSEVLAGLARACAGAGVEFTVAQRPLEVLWEKFVQLVPISASTGLLRSSIGVVRDDPESWSLFMRLMDETVAVGRATGVAISSEVVERRLEYVRSMPHGAMASMAEDLSQGRRLELPWLSGRVSELGRIHGVATPANDFVNVALKRFSMGAALQAA